MLYPITSYLAAFDKAYSGKSRKEVESNRGVSFQFEAESVDCARAKIYAEILRIWEKNYPDGEVISEYKRSLTFEGDDLVLVDGEDRWVTRLSVEKVGEVYLCKVMQYSGSSRMLTLQIIFRGDLVPTEINEPLPSRTTPFEEITSLESYETIVALALYSTRNQSRY